MIIWLASYPKSGNTLLRAIISSILFTDDGIFQPNIIGKIKQFPTQENFENFTKNFNDFNETMRYSIMAQDFINLNNEINFLKTHHLNCKINNFNFTNQENTLATIYIVRDPRNVVTSVSNHFSKTIQEAKEFLFTQKFIGGSNKLGLEINNDVKTLIGTWSKHYNFWKNSRNLFLIKFEDLIYDPKTEIKKIIIFLNNFLNIKINETKLDNICKTTSFENLQKIEKNGLFKENAYQNTNIKKKFFNLGPNNKWQSLLEKKVSDEIEKKFFKEMTELKYI